MFHVRGEGELVRSGFNFYPWRERKYSVGFVFMWGKKGRRRHWSLRYAPHVNRLHNYVEKEESYG